MAPRHAHGSTAAARPFASPGISKVKVWNRALLIIGCTHFVGEKYRLNNALQKVARGNASARFESLGISKVKLWNGAMRVTGAPHFVGDKYHANNILQRPAHENAIAQIKQDVSVQWVLSKYLRAD